MQIRSWLVLLIDKNYLLF